MRRASCEAERSSRPSPGMYGYAKSGSCQRRPQRLRIHSQTLPHISSHPKALSPQENIRLHWHCRFLSPRSSPALGRLPVPRRRACRRCHGLPSPILAPTGGTPSNRAPTGRLSASDGSANHRTPSPRSSSHLRPDCSPRHADRPQGPQLPPPPHTPGIAPRSRDSGRSGSHTTDPSRAAAFRSPVPEHPRSRSPSGRDPPAQRETPYPPA
jgi:hypothetical protein